MDDLRYALRTLSRNAAFTAVAVLTLALGIGATTAMFSVISAVLLDPLGYKDVDRLMVVNEKDEKHNVVQPYSLSYPNFQDWSAGQRSFSDFALFRIATGYKVLGSDRMIANVRMVSANFFSILGVSPIVGRNFVSDDDRDGAMPAIILSYSGWRKLLGFGPSQASAVAPASLLDERLNLNGTTYDVIGVLPQQFAFYTADSNSNPDGYIPIRSSHEPWTTARVRRPGISALGRLKPGVTRLAAASELGAIARQLAVLYPDANENRGAAVDPILDTIVREDLRTTFFFFAVAVVLVLLIACANITNLLLARATTRQKEIAIRFAVGGRWQVVKQLTVETLLLTLAGCASGVVVAIVSLDLLVLSAPFGLPRLANIGINARVLGFSVALSILSGLAFSIAPILQAWCTNILPELKEGGTSSVAARHTLQKLIIIGEVALGMILLLGAGLILRSTQKALNTDPGFDPNNMWSFSIVVSPPDYATASERRRLLREVESRFAAMPEARAVTLAIGGLPKPIAVNASYLRLMGIRLMKGRFFDERDSSTAPSTIVIDDVLARARFRDEEPLGKPFVIDLPGVRALQLDRPREVIGVVSHIQRLGIETEDETIIQSQFYLPADQLPDELMEGVAPRVMIRGAWPEEKLQNRFETVVRAVNPNLEMTPPVKMQDAVERALLPRRFVSRLFAVFAFVAFILSGMGIFGLVSYSVSQRTPEIGVRMAVGAESSHVVRMMIREAALLAITGIALGWIASFWLKHFVEHLLFGVSATDPATYIGASLLLFGVAIAAASLPALRASRLEPMAALRNVGAGFSRRVRASAGSGVAGEYVIEVFNLQKTYTTLRGKTAPALTGVSFHVEPGTIFGLIGQNGAGKTTLVKILMGLAKPTTGSAKVLGCSPGHVVAKRQIGFLPENMRIPAHFLPEDFLRYMGKLNEVDSATLDARIPSLLEKVGLANVRKPVKSFSKGMQQRLGIAQALLNDPELLFLDEPTDGLDPLGRILVRDLLVQLR